MGVDQMLGEGGAYGKEGMDWTAHRGAQNDTTPYREATGKQVGGEFLDQRLRHMLARLRQIGAVDYRLEHWGSGGLFRFSCAMPLVGHQNQLCQFEAINEDVTCAVDTVLSDVAEKRAESRDSKLRLLSPEP